MADLWVLLDWIVRVITFPFDFLLRYLLSIVSQSIVTDKKVFKYVLKTLRIGMYPAKGAILLCTAFAPFSKSKKLPSISNDLLLISAKQLAEKIRNQEVKCVDVIEAYIERIKDVNPVLNCVVEDRFKAALQEARTIDELLTNRPNPEFWATSKPLLGVPITVKETIAVQGMSNAAAWTLDPDRRAKTDAEAIALLRRAGVITLLVSNTPQLCIAWETYNYKTGTSCNPYDTRRTCAGSSGGEGALVGSGASVVGIGSDIGGSIRLPAMFCGVFGHKPTPGFISNDNHLPQSKDPDWDKYFTVGPLVRYAEDLPLIVRHMIPDNRRPHLLRLDEPVDMSKVKVYYLEGEGPNAILCDPIGSDVRRALIKAVHSLQSTFDIKAQKANLKDIEDHLALIGILVLRMECIENIYQKNIQDPTEWNSVAPILLKKMLMLSDNDMLPTAYGPLKAIMDRIPDQQYKEILKIKAKLQRQMFDLLGDNGVLLYPTWPWPAPFHKRTFFQFFNSAYATLFNFLEMPVTQCPIDITQEGLPVGIQIASNQKNDRLCMAVAKALEDGLGGWKPPRSQMF